MGISKWNNKTFNKHRSPPMHRRDKFYRSERASVCVCIRFVFPTMTHGNNMNLYISLQLSLFCFHFNISKFINAKRNGWKAERKRTNEKSRLFFIMNKDEMKQCDNGHFPNAFKLVFETHKSKEKRKNAASLRYLSVLLVSVEAIKKPSSQLD